MDVKLHISDRDRALFVLSPPDRTKSNPASLTIGSVFHLSRGLDVDSGDEDYVENNNVSKSSSFESHTKLTHEATTKREYRYTSDWCYGNALIAIC